MLGPNDYKRFTFLIEHVIVTLSGNGSSKGGQNILSVITAMVVHIVRPLHAANSDGVRRPVKSPLYMKRFPGTQFLIFSDAEGILARLSVGGHVQFARKATTDVDQNESNRSTHTGIGSMSLAKDVMA